MEFRFSGISVLSWVVRVAWLGIKVENTSGEIARHLLNRTSLLLQFTAYIRMWAEMPAEQLRYNRYGFGGANGALYFLTYLMSFAAIGMGEMKDCDSTAASGGDCSSYDTCKW